MGMVQYHGICVMAAYAWWHRASGSHARRKNYETRVKTLKPSQNDFMMFFDVHKEDPTRRSHFFLLNASRYDISMNITTTNSSKFHKCHHPDEYVDAAILIYPEPREKQLDLLPSPKDVLRFLHHLKTMCEQQPPQQAMPSSKALMQTNILNLSDYHLPDEYCDASTLFTYDENKHGEELPSSRDIVSSFLSWLHHSTHDDNDTSSATLDTSVMQNVDISSCHLPEDYIDSSVVCESPLVVEKTTSSTTGDLFDSIAFFLTRGNEKREKDTSLARCESPNNISMAECDLPDEFVDAVISCNDSVSDPTPLDRLNDKIRQVLSPISKQSSSTIIKANDDTTRDTNQKVGGVGWEKTKSEMSVGSLDSTVPKASSPRGTLVLRKRTQSTPKVGQAP